MKTNNINFFKKIYISICKIKEYGKLSKEGMKKGIYYTMDLMVICSLIYALILTIKLKANVDGLQEYLEEKFPELTYEDNTLLSEKSERVVLDDNLVKINFGGNLVIDTTEDYETIINEYRDCGEATILLTSNKYVTINSQGDVYEYDYNVVLNTDEKTTIGKDYFVNLLSSISYTYYFFGYFVGGIIAASLVLYVYNIIITLIIFIFCKVKKIKAKFGEIYSMGLYAHTISIFIFFVINALPTVIVPYAQVLEFLLPAVYLGYAVYLNKWKLPENLA